MSFLCCGVKYSKNDPETYWCIDTDINKPVQKKFIGNERVVKEIVDSLTCKKNGCLKVQIRRYGNLRGKNKLLEIEELSGKKAFNYLEQTSKIRQRQPLNCPVQKIPYAKHIDFVYGKVVDATTQRKRYLNETDWADDKLINAPVKIIQ